ncbi:MAG: MBL fold metallo-hydrolase [Candidatus Anammoxibacter sp.]
MINIKRILVSPLESSCYIVSVESTSNAMLVDPGGDADLIIAYCKEINRIPSLIVNTHGHGDHIGANKELKKTYPNINICIHVDDEPMLTNEYLNLSLLGGKRYKSPPADRTLQHNDQILFDDVEFTVIHVPGHTKGGICLLYNPSISDSTETGKNDNHPVLFSGDSLFNGGIGRTDLPNGSFDTLVDAIRNKLFVLDEDTIVYPGHGEETTIFKEREGNPFLSLQEV